MFENIVNLDVNRHKAATFVPSTNLKYASHIHMAPVVASEIDKAMRLFPIIFSNADVAQPVVIMSLREHENAFIDENGGWLGDYLPAHIRRYPFMLAATDEDGKFAIMIDQNALQEDGTTGSRLYEENGDFSPALKEATAFLQAFQSENATTGQMVQPLVEKDVLTSQDINVTQPDGRSFTFEGVRAVDIERVHALDDATLAGWVRSGLMALIHAHLCSLDNVSRLASRQGMF